MRVTALFAASIVSMLPATTVAAPIRLRLLGQVEAAYSFQWTGLPLPPCVVQGAQVGIDLMFEPVILRYPQGVQPTPGAIHLEGWEPHYVPSAEPVIIQLLDGAITIGGEMFHWTDGKLFVMDNQLGGACAGFNCTTWTSDTIDLIAWGEVGKLGNGVRFSTMGGLSSPQHAFGFPANDTLTAGSDLARLETWARFPDSSFYVQFRSADGSRQANVSVLLTNVMGVPEPTAIHLMVAALMLLTNRRCRRCGCTRDIEHTPR